jgi:hypothetical protein
MRVRRAIKSLVLTATAGVLLGSGCLFLTSSFADLAGVVAQ